MMLFFILIHEMGHIIGFVLFKIKIHSISLNPFGIAIKRTNTYKPLWQEGMIYFLGPLFNLISILIIITFYGDSIHTHNAVAINIVMFVFNLIPIGNLDGGNILRLILNKYTKAESLDKLFQIISLSLLIPLFSLAIFLSISSFKNYTLLITCMYLLYSCLFSKSIV